MPMDFFSILTAQGSASSVRAAQAENSARLAMSCHIVESKGTSSRRIDAPVMFQVAFLPPPFIVTGTSIKTDLDPSVSWVPRADVGLWRWHRNEKGHYTGAYVYVQVSGGTWGSEFQHNLIFYGIAYKDLGQAAATEAQLLTSRPVGFGGL